jgi:tRNA threonylcarbamoyladenosine biosynthesis protein TsaE
VCIVIFSAYVFVKTLCLNNELATQALARDLAQRAQAPLLIFLNGELGAGKTFFVRAFLAALGFHGRVKSPTFTLMEPYNLHRPETSAGLKSIAVYHFDFYRFTSGSDWRDAGFEEYLPGDGIALVEWPSNAKGLPLPDIELHFMLTANVDERIVNIKTFSDRGAAALALSL